MTISTDSVLDTYLPQEPLLEDNSTEAIYAELAAIYNAIQILTNEVERIRIATGTPPPP